MFRQRLPEEVFAAAHEVVLEGLRTHGLLRGRHLGIDSRVMEANASLSRPARRNDDKSFWNHGRELAKEAGVEAEDPVAVARFDRRRKDRKISNNERVNLADPDAKVGRTKDGACDMIYRRPQGDSGPFVISEISANRSTSWTWRAGLSSPPPCVRAMPGTPGICQAACWMPWNWWRKFMGGNTKREPPM